MLNRLAMLAAQERPSFALVAIAGKLTDHFRGRVVAKLLGWNKSYIGHGSKVIGTKSINVKGSAYINRYAWIEAVHNFRGQTFTPVIIIGHGLAVSDRLHISAINRIEIGNYCLFGSGVYIGDHNHGSYKSEEQSNPSEIPVQRKLVSFGAVIIGSNVWLGDNVIIVGPVKIGNGVVIGANSVITKDVPENVMVAGNPFKILKKFNESTGVWDIVDRSVSLSSELA